MESKLYAVDEVISFIEKGYLMSLAGDERVLSRLPKGNWIAGTIPYFMDTDRGLFTQEQIYVNMLLESGEAFSIKTYDDGNMDEIIPDSYDNGYTLLIIPAFQNIHQKYAIESETMDGLYNNPIVGWVAGMDLNSTDSPKTYNGLMFESYNDKAVAVHVKLPKNKFAQIEIVNIFNQNEESPDIQFYNNSFEVINCLINGEEVRLADYLDENKIDPKLPLIADYSGASINVSIKEINTETGIVSFYAPVFSSKTYRFPKPVLNYIEEFSHNTINIKPINEFSCNCILNYMYGELEDRKIENVKGPITFGEIGYQLLNQTLVTLSVEEL